MPNLGLQAATAATAAAAAAKPLNGLGQQTMGAFGGMFYGMIAPFLPMRLTAIWWYQGEANEFTHTDQFKGPWWYSCLFPSMITGWRAAFESPGLPFYYVLLAAGSQSLLRESQMAAGRLAHTAFASALDLGASAAEEAAGFQPGHPIRKQEVGRRLALNARAMIYGDMALASTREGPVVTGYTLGRLTGGAGGAGSSGAATLSVTLKFNPASAVGLHVAATAPCCTANTTAAACAACCTNATSSPVTFTDPDAGSMLAPASKLFARVVVVDAAASTLTASLPVGATFNSSKGRVQIEFLFEIAPLCGVYNGAGGANDHAGVIATPYRVNTTLNAAAAAAAPPPPLYTGGY